MTWSVPRMWDGGRCFIIGGGPSMPGQFDIPPEIMARVHDKADSTGPEAYSPYMETIYHEHVIVVNDGYRLGSWPDICFFGDHGWYKVHRQALSLWPGLKVTCCPALRGNNDGIKHLGRDRTRRVGLSDNPSMVVWGFNSGSSAIDFGIHLGVRQVFLLGFDMSHGPAGESHWHQGHGNERRPRANYDRFMRGFPVMAADAAKMGIEIINCSPGTAIMDFPVATLKEVL